MDQSRCRLWMGSADIGEDPSEQPRRAGHTVDMESASDPSVFKSCFDELPTFGPRE